MTRDIPIDPVLEKGYDVRLLRSDFADLVEVWSARSAELRASSDSVLDCTYAGGDRDKLDIFRCGEKNAPLFVFIHGGYWQRGDKSIYSFVANSFLESGADVALIGYELCPATDLTRMAGKMRSALTWLWISADEFGISADRINVSGHSAGGHLTAMLLTTAWNEIDPTLPRDLIKSGIPISGLYQLDPLRRTTISDALHLDDRSSEANSPHFMRPASDAPILVTLGGAETPQFHWQTDQFVAAWGEHGVELQHHAEPDVDHFDVVNRLADTSSAIFQKTRAWMR